jgi:SAM-dependent methyltransferase
LNDKAYFSLYEDRYRRLGEQGVEDWIYRPQELANTFNAVDEFLSYAHSESSKTSIIELGCGQGHLAEYLIDNGYKYLGVDISGTAIQQARKKTYGKGNGIFLLADVTDLSRIPDNSYDLAIDNQCFHMLITDEHRSKYLSELKRVLKKDGKAFFHENFQPDEFRETIKNLDQFNKTFSNDQKGPGNYTAFVNGEKRIVELPRLPARANNEEGYRKELTRAGLNIAYFKQVMTLCTIYTSIMKKGKTNNNHG